MVLVFEVVVVVVLVGVGVGVVVVMVLCEEVVGLTLVSVWWV